MSESEGSVGNDAMSTEQYPEVSGDESGIVPSQGARTPEWPKKIRTLTASELDRLTIDGNGRFYWDGKLVNYEPPLSGGPIGQSPEAREQSAMDIIDRAVHDLAEQQRPGPIEGASLPELRHSVAGFDMARLEQEVALPALAADPGPAQVIRTSDQVHVTLSRLQTIAVVVALLAFVTGAIGVATYSYVAMRDWSCRIDSKQSNCPIVPVAKPVPRPDIPA